MPTDYEDVDWQSMPLHTQFFLGPRFGDVLRRVFEIELSEDEVHALRALFACAANREMMEILIDGEPGAAPDWIISSCRDYLQSSAESGQKVRGAADSDERTSLDDSVRVILQAATLWKDGDPRGGFRCGYVLATFAGHLHTEKEKSMCATEAGERTREAARSNWEEWQRLVEEAAERDESCKSYDELCRRAAKLAPINPKTGKRFHWETIKKQTRNPLKN